VTAPKRPSPRPRFQLRSALPAAEIRKRVREFVAESSRVRGVTYDERYEVSMEGEELHFWSPQICVNVKPREDGGTDLDARLGPDPYVWTMYVFAYATLTVASVFASVFGLTQWTLGHSPTALYVAPAAAVTAALVYGASYVGQGLGAEQMYFLRATITTLSEGEDVEER
jgi:hypothetical protein